MVPTAGMESRSAPLLLDVSGDGWLTVDGPVASRFRCALGRAGIVRDKREGDGATPSGRFPLREVRFRSDRLPRPVTDLPCREIDPNDGWCDDPADPAYNRPVGLPYPARHERLWREDGLYDVVVILGHNDAPPIPGHGSCIFLHVAADAYRATEGCVALARTDLLTLLRWAGPGSVIRIPEP